MFATYFQPSSEQESAALRRRSIVFPLVLLAHLLIVWLLMQVATIVNPPKPRLPNVFNLSPDKGDEAKATVVRKAARAASGAKAKARPVATKPPPATRMDATTSDSAAFAKLLVPGAEDFDIRKLPQHNGQQLAEGNAEGAGPGADGGAGDGGGAGPGGERLYDADWYRRPTDAELGGYLPKNGVHSGSGLIACRTVADNRVEDCHILGEDPPGSGFGRAVLNAAWQFRVMPPRVGSKRLIGTWVRIRIDYTERGVEVR